MEGNNELYRNENGTSSENLCIADTIPAEGVSSEKNMDVFMQTLLSKVEQVIDQKLTQVSPTINKAAAPNESVSLSEYAAMKNRLEHLEQTQKSLLHHDLGTGQVNSPPLYDRDRTLEQNVKEYIRNKYRR